MSNTRRQNQYEVACEISGLTAMWTRPDTGDVPVSYPAPTLGAVKGIFESIVWLKSAEVVPTRVEFCALMRKRDCYTSRGQE